MSDDLVAFVYARMDEEVPAESCGCLDANHWPPCTPQPWRDRKLRELAAIRAVVADYESSVRTVSEGLSVARRRLVLFFAAIWDDHPGYDPAWSPTA